MKRGPADGAGPRRIQRGGALSVSGQNEAMLDIRQVSKAFPGVQALSSITFSVRRAEVHAVVGENGAGKSTLMKILSGAQAPDSGSVVVGGREITTWSPETSRRMGIAIIYQEFNLIPHLSAAQNISLGREPGAAGWIDNRRVRDMARFWLQEMDAGIPPEAPVSSLSVANRQLVEIAKALSQDASLLIMDEPASALSVRERERLFDVIEKLRKRGITILYVSHSMEEIFRVAQSVTVLKDGEHVCTRRTGETTPADLITSMIGRKLDMVFPARAAWPVRSFSRWMICTRAARWMESPFPSGPGKSSVSTVLWAQGGRSCARHSSARVRPVEA